MHAITCANVTGIKLNKRSQAQKRILFESAYMKFKYRGNWVREVRLVPTSLGVFTERRPNQESF